MSDGFLSLFAAIQDELACPACYGVLRAEASHLLCTSCARTYPVIDGIPVLIADRSTPDPTKPDSTHPA